MEGTFDVAISYKNKNNPDTDWVFNRKEIEASSDEHAVALATISLMNSMNFTANSEIIITGAEITKRELR